MYREQHGKTIPYSSLNGRDNGVGSGGLSSPPSNPLTTTHRHTRSHSATHILHNFASSNNSSSTSSLNSSPSDWSHNVHFGQPHHRNLKASKNRSAEEASVENGNNHHNHQHQMSVEQSICDDLQMFEQRLEEVLAQLRPRSKLWQVILVLSFLTTMVGAFHWLTDPQTYEVSFVQSFWHHKFFTVNCVLLIGLFVVGGIHRRIFSPSIITARVREVISQFNMSCDDRGKLILMPHPNYYNNGH